MRVEPLKGSRLNASKKRLLVLDIDNTLLHIPVYDPMLPLLSGSELSEDEFYKSLPEGGLLLSENSSLTVYPRPHLHTFLTKVCTLGYDLAICTTATYEYLHKALTVCGVAIDQFVAIIDREQLKAQGNSGLKDIRPFIDFGYEVDDIVVIDDKSNVYIQPENVLQIQAFNAVADNFQEDVELLLMIERLEHLGVQSLPVLRKAQAMALDRERSLAKLAELAFDAKKYRDLPFAPQIYTKTIYDLEQLPVVEEDDFRQGIFLIYIDYGLVGAIKLEEEIYTINNYCPNVWTEVSAGISRFSRSSQALAEIFWMQHKCRLREVCSDLGYDVTEDNFLWLAALTLESTYSGLHVLPMRTVFQDKDPMTFV